jgi:hypothetical protein
LHVDHQQGCSLGVQRFKPVELTAPSQHSFNDMAADTDVMHVEFLQANGLCFATDFGRVAASPAGSLPSPDAIAMM